MCVVYVVVFFVVLGGALWYGIGQDLYKKR